MALKSYLAFYIGPVQVQVWGFFVALGMLLTILILWKRGKRLGFDVEQVLSLAIYMIVGGFIGARLFHVLFYEPAYYLNNIFEIVKVWKGGLSSFGGITGAVLGAYLFVKLKKVFKDKILKVVDLISFSALFGWILGRVGCLMIHDHLGNLSNSVFSVKTTDGARLEMAGLEIVGLLPLAVVFYIIAFKEKKLARRSPKGRDGVFTSLLFIYYGILRFILDFFRATDTLHSDARYLGLTPGQYFGMVIVVVGVFLFKRKVRIVV